MQAAGLAIRTLFTYPALFALTIIRLIVTFRQGGVLTTPPCLRHNEVARVRPQQKESMHEPVSPRPSMGHPRRYRPFSVDIARGRTTVRSRSIRRHEHPFVGITHYRAGTTRPARQDVLGS